MKARKTMKNQALIQEVIQQISQRFTPKIPDIKKVRRRHACSLSLVLSSHRAVLTGRSLASCQAIDHLLEKEYIERVEGTRDTFAYVA